MKIKKHKYHNVGKLFRVDDAGISLDGLTDGANLGGGTSTTTTTETEEAKAARLLAEGATKTAADAATKLAEDIAFAKTLGGEKLDEAGNVIDAAGKIIKTVAEIEKLAEPKAVEIDGVEYQINDKGEAVDKEGKVVRTKEEVDSLIEEDSQIPLIEELQTKSGVIIKGEDGKPKVYEDTTEGLLQWNNDLAEYKSNEAQKKFFEAFPDVADYARYLQRGGDKKDYFTKQASSWLNVKLDENSEEQLNNVVISNLISKGVSKDEAEFIAKTYKDTGKLKEFGKAAFTSLQNEEKEGIKKSDALYKQQIDDHNQKMEAHFNNINEIIKKGNISNITIPEIEREKFFKAVALDADGKGNSLIDIKESKLSNEQLLQLKWFIYNDFNLDKMVKNAMGTEKVKLLRQRVNKHIHTGTGGGKGIDKTQYGKPNNNADGISMNDFSVAK